MIAAERIPAATYRLQLNRGLRFADARRLIGYLEALGVSDLYVSPIFTARPGSAHGYDVIDPTRINPDLGAESDLLELGAELRHRGMGLLVDIVPNHMAACLENPWWADVLEYGRHSPFAAFFDIDWDARDAPGAVPGRVCLPILAAPYGVELEQGRIRLRHDAAGCVVEYGDLRLPVAARSLGPLLGRASAHLETATGVRAKRAHADLAALAAAADVLRTAQRTGALELDIRQEAVAVKTQLAAICESSTDAQAAVRRAISATNGNRGDAASFQTLDELLVAQHYRLCCWRSAPEAVNYRRFFDINDLVGVRVEEPAVFDAVHARLLELVRDRCISALRVDHIDGLADPGGYLHRLQAGLMRYTRRPTPIYVVVEKILAADEALPEDWPAHGTTGYDFLNAVNGVFVDPKGVQALTKEYGRLAGADHGEAALSVQCRADVLCEQFHGRLRALAIELWRLALNDRHACDLTPDRLERALRNVTVCLPGYRAYVRDDSPSTGDRARLQAAVEASQPLVGCDSGRQALDFVARVLTMSRPPQEPDGRRSWLEFVTGWQQFTGTVAAKGIEDTAFYRRPVLLSLNEVGADARRLDAFAGVDEFHRRMADRRARQPAALNATSTHDTKRSEDVRARLNVLSEMPAVWSRCVARWRNLNKAHRRARLDPPAPDLDDELYLYQTLIGAWPLKASEVGPFAVRLKAHLVKAAREAKRRTNWHRPDEAYEKALQGFAAALLRKNPRNRFLSDFLALHKRVAFFGAVNSLAQTLLKIAAPGVPDTYQGSELFDFSLTDPDNRRPVDFDLRERRLAALDAALERDRAAALAELLAEWSDGRVKLFLTRAALQFRRARASLFANGEYVPLPAVGPRAGNVCAFGRRERNQWVVAVVPRLASALGPTGRFPLGRTVWRNTALRLPAGAPSAWENGLTGDRCACQLASDGTQRLFVGDALTAFPAALLAGRVR